jgi:hypothetical protein
MYADEVLGDMKGVGHKAGGRIHGGNACHTQSLQIRRWVASFAVSTDIHTHYSFAIFAFSRGNTCLSLDSALPFFNSEANDPQPDTPDNSNPENTNQNEKSSSDRAYDEDSQPSPDLISLKRNDWWFAPFEATTLRLEV